MFVVPLLRKELMWPTVQDHSHLISPSCKQACNASSTARLRRRTKMVGAVLATSWTSRAVEPLWYGMVILTLCLCVTYDHIYVWHCGIPLPLLVELMAIGLVLNTWLQTTHHCWTLLKVPTCTRFTSLARFTDMMATCMMYQEIHSTPLIPFSKVHHNHH